MQFACCNLGVDDRACLAMEIFLGLHYKVANTVPFCQTNALDLVHRIHVVKTKLDQIVAAT